jgi:uncharacterized protein YjiS (DUF1127 family)
MHMAEIATRPLHRLGGGAAAVVRGAGAVIKSLVRSWRNRRVVGDLLEFDDRMLADIGLMRGDVTAALSSPSGTDPSTRLRIFAVERRAGLRAQALEREARRAARLTGESVE